MKDIRTYCEEYISPEIKIVRMGSPERICVGSGDSDFGETGIPGMKDNDW